MRRLIGSIGNINAETHSYYGTALAAAAYQGKHQIVSLLLDRGADINTIGGRYGTSLGAAIYAGKEENVFLLLGRGANITNALGAAKSRGKEKLVLLLDQEAVINGTTLAKAAYKGKHFLVSSLLDRGADINAVWGGYGTALAAAAYQGNLQIALLLLDRGADINAVGGEYGTALAVAAYRAKEKFMSLLLDRGADINAVGGEYGTALATAAYRGKHQIVSLLLDRGADINLVGGTFGTALGTAVYKGNTEIVSLLLDRGADVMRVGGSYSTTLGVYPSALDAAGRRADQTLLTLLQTAIREQYRTRNPPDLNSDRFGDVIDRPPFPMPYTSRSSALYHILPPSPLDILLPAGLRAGDNITSELADIPCRVLNEEDLFRSLTVLVNLHEDTAHRLAKSQWIRNDIRYFISCDFDFGLAYAAARTAWKGFNEDSADSSVISIQRARWHNYAQILNEARSKAIEIDHSSSGLELIISPYSVMPRRLWDLKSNRVVDFQMLHSAQLPTVTPPTFWAVSHSWTKDMRSVSTTINQHQWPVPLPNSITLDYLRS